MLNFILQCAYFMVPAYFANMAPVFCKGILKSSAKPINVRMFGEHKTWRGIIVAVFFGVFLAYLQHILYNDYTWAANISLVNYSNWFLFGLFMGSGAILGDLIKSFFKRRIGIKPGEKWIFFDQVDYAIGALLFTSLVYTPSLALILTVIAISFFGNILVNHAAFWLDIRKEKW